MTDSYEKVRGNAVLEATREKAQLILELESTWLPLFSWMARRHRADDAKRFPRWLHVLKPIEDESDRIVHDGEWSARGSTHARLHAMRNEMKAMRAHLSAVTDQNKSELEKRTSALHEQLRPLEQVMERA